MHNATHIIQRQIVEVETPDIAKSLGFQQELSDVYYAELLPEIEKLFDETCKDDYLIRIDKMPVEIEIEDGKHWQKEFVEKSLYQIKSALRQANKIEAQQQDVEPEVLFYFLENGDLPWYANQKSLHELSVVIKEKILTDDAFKESFLTRLNSILKHSAVARKRLVYQFKPDMLEIYFSGSLLRRILLKWVGKMNSILNTQKHYLYWLAFIDTWCGCKNEAKAGKDIERYALTTLLNHGKKYINIPEWQRSLTEDDNRFVTNVLRSNHIKNIDDTYLPADFPFTENENSIPGSEKIADEIFVSNAGLVIIHPFLALFFKELEIWNGKEFVTEEAHQRAVLLTQYLVTNTTESTEHDLFLNKLVCNYPMEETLPSEIETSDKEKEECNALLNSIIDNWKMNGRQIITSIENLQVSFLQRQGKLSRRDNGWLLQVEQRGYDIVLSGLPWGIGTIRLPWMKEILHVEWA